MSVYNWLDKKLGGWLPGGVPRGGSKQEGSDPTNTEDAVATAAGANQEASNSKPPQPTTLPLHLQVFNTLPEIEYIMICLPAKEPPVDELNDLFR